MFSGVFTAIITPFQGNRIDYERLAQNLEMQIKAGIAGVVPVGTTGESPSLSHAEHSELIQKTVEIVGKRIKVIAGTGSNSTEEAIFLTTAAEKAGADGALLVNPYYNKPPQRGMIEHFQTIASSVTMPIMLYNIPGRTGVNLLPESVATLCEKADNIVAIKEASGDINQMMRVIEICGDRIDVLSGDDNLFLPVMAIGGKGVVSVLANLLPKEMTQVYDYCAQGAFAEARELFYKLLPLCRAMFLETNPIPIKTAMAMAGLSSEEIRLPLVQLAEDKKQQLKEVLKGYGVQV
jgi:4-hydroxy-tetrahydrodipicolinate synthase